MEAARASCSPPCKMWGGSQQAPPRGPRRRQTLVARLTNVNPGNAFATRLAGLLDLHSRDRAGDHQLLDLGCALEDVVDQPEMAL